MFTLCLSRFVSTYFGKVRGKLKELRLRLANWQLAGQKSTAKCSKFIRQRGKRPLIGSSETPKEKNHNKKIHPHHAVSTVTDQYQRHNN